MLEQLFRLQSAIARHRNAPFLREREEYLTHLNAEGLSLGSLRVVAARLANFARHVDAGSLRDVDHAEVQRVATAWAAEGWPRIKGRTANVREFKRVVVAWIMFHGGVIHTASATAPYGDLLPSYIAFVSGPMHLSPETVRSYKSASSRFLEWASKRCNNLADVELEDVQTYFLELEAAGMKPGYVATIARTLRSLFKFAESQGCARPRLWAALRAPAVRRLDPSPKGPRWSEVLRMLTTQTAGGSAALRATAVLHLFAFYALRAAEVRNLMLDDVDWEERTITVRRVKHGRFQRFPLTARVARALMSYLEDARPRCACRNLFVTLHPKYRPISHATMRHVVATRFGALGIKSTVYSTHALRHSCATELLRRGLSMQEIARFLGHVNNNSVSIYAKASRASLRNVAEWDLRFMQ